MQRRAQRHRQRPDDHAPREEQKPPRKSGISDALRWMDESGTARPPAEARPREEKVDREAVAQGRRPIQVRPGEQSREQPRQKSKDPAQPKKKSKPARKASASGPLEPIRRPKKEPPPTPAWGDAAARPPSSKLEEALSWMDSAEAKPLPDAPAPGQRPATGKVEAVLSWMDELSGPFEEVVRGPRRTQKRPGEKERSERPAPPSPGPAGQETSAPRRASTGKLKRETVNELLARADRVTKRPSAPPPPPPLPSPAAAESSELGPPEEGFGPLSASDVWMLAQTPEDVLAGARRPKTADAPQPPAPPLPPPTPRRITSSTPVDDEQQRDTRRAKVDELLEWTQDLLGALEDSDSSAGGLVVPEEPVLPASDAARSVRSTDVCELELCVEEEPPPDPDPPEPPRRRSSRLFRLQQQLDAMPQPPAWSALPDPDALARLQRSASSAFGPAPDPFQNDPLAGLDPYASVLPPVPEVPRDPRCRDPFCTDPRCLKGEATPPPPPAPPAPPGSWGKKVRIVRPGAA